ncbi:MAG: transcription termination factor Rho [Verrucomicrobia bacterium GWF2_51_19]|nr:MAG: transcription termination factor Rho [Verrucomicrobia bacterium GWF2_51_19]HCJ11503.1 transcription termination factor Rho [Opitutae bacterium]
MPEFEEISIPLEKPDMLPTSTRGGLVPQKVRRGRPRKRVEDALPERQEELAFETSVARVESVPETPVAERVVEERVVTETFVEARAVEERPIDQEPRQRRRYSRERNTDERERPIRRRREPSEGRQNNRPERRSSVQNNGPIRRERQRPEIPEAPVSRQQRPEIYFGDYQNSEIFAQEDALEAFVQEFTDSTQTPFDLKSVYQLSTQELVEAAQALGVAVEVSRNVSRRQVFKDLLTVLFETRRPIHVEGVLSMTDQGLFVLVYASDNYRIREQSTFVPTMLVNKYHLKRGHVVKAQLCPPHMRESCPAAIRILSVNDLEPEKIKELPHFKDLTPYYPTQRILLELPENEEGWDNHSMRVIDILTPIGLGQRGLIVAPPRTGKTILLQNIAHAISTNHPHVHLIILLVDERPEEVTDFERRITNAEVISSTFDETADKHVQAAEAVIEKARRMVECGKHVVILLDSITRLARAYNTLMPNSGKILSGGVESNALQLPKRFFGSARNIEGAGSLTILATALIETGSKMDDVIFEEFKGTGNMELHLDRGLVDKRIFPAISFDKSGTRKEELLYHPEEIEKIYALRRAMKGAPSIDAMEMLITRIKKTRNNVEFLLHVNR